MYEYEDAFREMASEFLARLAVPSPSPSFYTFDCAVVRLVNGALLVKSRISVTFRSS